MKSSIETVRSDFRRVARSSVESPEKLNPLNLPMYQFAKALAEPYTLLYLAIGFALWRGRSRSIHRSGWLTLACMFWFVGYGLSITPVSHELLKRWTVGMDQDDRIDDTVDCIIVLGGGVVPIESTPGTAALTRSSTERCLHAIELYNRCRPCRLLLCGGKPDSTADLPAEAAEMQRFLVRLGVDPDDILLETRSKSTDENIRFAAETIRSAGFNHVVLVTNRFHLPRAVRCARREVISVIPSAALGDVKLQARDWYDYVLPNIDAVDRSHSVLAELEAVLFYSLRESSAG